MPYVGIPAAFKNSPSVAPGCKIGSTGTPGKYSAASFFIGANICAVNGGGGELGPRVSNVETTTFGSATNCSSLLRTLSASTPGKMRQLILALARCGSALGRLYFSHAGEIGAVAVRELRRKNVAFDAQQRRGKPVDGIVLERPGAMTAGLGCFQV